MKLYPRKCENCGKGMREGYVLHDAGNYCGTDCLLETLYNNDVCYFTDWEDSDVMDEGLMYDSKGSEWNIKQNKTEKKNDKV